MRLPRLLRDARRNDRQDDLMADVFNSLQRSEIMSRVRGRGNKSTELALVRLFRKHGITGWRRNTRFFGKPDFAFPKLRVAIFVDGCFWHSCPKHQSTPASNRSFWQRKLQRNKARDRLVRRTLKEHGWTVLRIWQHELTARNAPRLTARIRQALIATRHKS